MRSLLTNFLFLCSLSAASAALTEHWVASNGTQTTWATCTGSTEPASNANRCTLATAISNAAAGDLIHVKNDATYSRTTTIDTITNAGTVTSPIIWRGYSTTINDGYQGRSNSGTGDLVTTNMPVITYSGTGRLVLTNFNIIESLNISGAPVSAVITIGGDNVLKSCKVVGTNTGAGSVITTNAANGAAIFDCDLQQTGAGTGTGVVLNGAASRLISCRVKGGTGTGALINAVSTAVLINNVIFSAGTGHAVTMGTTSGTVTWYGNTIVSSGGDAINIGTGTLHLQAFINNLITDNTGAGVNMVSTSNAGVLLYNRFRDNTGGNTANGGDWITAANYSSVTSGNGTSDYTNAGSNDYTLISTSPAVAAGYYPYRDIGAFQRQASAGGGQRSWIGWIQFVNWLKSGGLIKR